MAHVELLPPLQQTSPLEIVGSFRASEIGRQAVRHAAVELITPRSFPGEVPHTFERRAQLASMDEAMFALGRDAGVNLSMSLPFESVHHFFKSTDDMKAALRSVGITPHPNQEAQTNEYGIFSVEGKDLFDTLNLVSHERFHFVDTAKMALRHQEDGSYASYGERAGYATNTMFRGLWEMFTDLRNVHLMKGGYWSARPNLPQPRDTYLYGSLDILGDTLLQKSARMQGIEPLGLLRSIERDQFLGESNGLRQLLAPFDTAAKSRLVHLPHTEPELARELAFDLGLPDAVAKMDAMHAGEPVEILDWLTPSQ